MSAREHETFLGLSPTEPKPNTNHIATKLNATHIYYYILFYFLFNGDRDGGPRCIARDINTPVRGGMGWAG